MWSTNFSMKIFNVKKEKKEYSAKRSQAFAVFHLRKLPKIYLLSIKSGFFFVPPHLLFGFTFENYFAFSYHPADLNPVGAAKTEGPGRSPRGASGVQCLRQFGRVRWPTQDRF